MSDLKNIPEAPESNAGDNFHVLWTIKKSFELLNFEDDGLKAITVEGIFEGSKLDPSGSNLLGVDIAEYFGADNFREANKVVVSQLKYSTRRIDENWTFSKIYTGKKGNTDGSIVHRLAQIYKVLITAYGRDSVLDKLTLKLVSNRPFSTKQLAYLLDIQQFLSTKTTNTNFDTLYKRFLKEQDALKKIYEATKLKSTEFTDFLKLLDLNDCGTESSYYQEIQIIEAINNVGITESYQKDSLFGMVWKKMLPDEVQRGNNRITDIDLLHVFKMSKEALFPVTQRFEKIESFVERIQLNDIVEQIINNNSGKPICIHGGAGIGKSSIVQLLESKITHNSEVVLFDCYGAGMYLNPSDNRQLHKEALLHICNEMARRIGSPFLLSKDSDPYIFIREFKRRVEYAVKVLKERDQSSLLVLMIDAADNSVIAADTNKTKCFIHDLLDENFVPGFRLIVTSRSHRVNSLKLPKDYIDIQLNAFEKEETQKLLSYHFPNSSIEDIEEFHKLTKGIPRVQAYALDLKREGIQEVINYLRPNGKGVEDLIQDRILEAGKRIGHEGYVIIEKLFQYLISLPRPVPISYLCDLVGVSEDIIKDLTTDIWHGLILENDQLTFRDEDFETFIREEYKTSKDILNKIADNLLHKANEDEYASWNLGTALFDANYTEALINAVLNEEYINYPVDPLRKKEVYVNRTTLAMKLCNKVNDNLTFFKLAFIAADAAKTGEALRNLLVSNVDLVASLGDVDSLNKIQLESEGKSWGGSFYYQMAAIYSRKDKSIEIVKTYLRSAKKWIDWRQNQEDTEELRDFVINTKDIACGAEAVLRVFGSQESYKWFIRWQPKEAIYEALNIFFDNILIHSTREQIDFWVKSINLPIIPKLIALKKFQNVSVESFDLNEITKQIASIYTRGIKLGRHIIPDVLSFCEILVRKEGTKSNKQLVLQILNSIDASISEHVPSLMDDSFTHNENDKLNVDIFLRRETLIHTLNNSSLELRSIYPEKLKNIDKISDYKTRQYREDDKRKFDRFYSVATEIYQLRADTYCRREEQNELMNRFIKVCKKNQNNSDIRYYDSIWASYRLKFLALILNDILPLLGNDYDLLSSIANSFEVKSKTEIQLRIALAKRLVTIKDFQSHCLKLLTEATSIINKSTLPSSEIVRHYIEAAKIGLFISESTAQFYFDKAIDAVSEIDLEAHAQIKCISKLSQLGIRKDNSELAFKFARFIEYSKVRLDGYDHFPIDEGIEGVASLDSASSFATLCRWGHRYVIDIPEKILIILQTSAENGFISSSIGSSLLPLNIYYWKSYVEYIKTLIEKLDNEGNYDSKNLLIKHVLRDVKINCTPYKKKETANNIFKLIENGKYLDRSLLIQFKEYVSFVNTIQPDEDSKPQNPFITESKNEKKIPFKVNDIEITSTTYLTEKIKLIQKTEESFTETSQLPDFLALIKEECNPQDFTAHLEALINIEPSLLHFYTFKNALQSRLEDWKSYPDVVLWAQNSFRRFIQLWFKEFHWYEYINFSGIMEFARYFFIDDEKLSEIFIDILPEKINELSASSIYQVIEFLGKNLNQKENEKLIKWILDIWNKPIKDDFTDGCSHDAFLPPDDPSKTIACAIRFVLGNPDKRVRWRGMHALRRIIESGNIRILEILLSLQNETTCHPFQNKGYAFFWMSAKLYLWICIFRLSQEFPDRIIKFKKEFFEELQNQKLPHVLIKHYIKNTCLNLNSFDTSIFSTEELEIISDVLQSKLPTTDKSVKREVMQNEKTGKERWSFRFDSMDTLPYWYDRLGRCFGLTANDVADIADQYITEKWGQVGDKWSENYVNADYNLTSNRHGSLPTVENLPLYYEYHAMFCAASELLDTVSLMKEDDDWGFYSWEGWIKSHGVIWEETWLSDLRDPIPQNKMFWSTEFSNFDENWEKNVEDHQYDKAVGFLTDSETNFIVPYGSFTRYFGKNYESVSISSALVSTNTAESLLRALQTTENCYDYHIPLEGEEAEVHVQNFELIGWLKTKYSENDEIEKNDPFVNQIDKNIVLFGKEVEDLFNIAYSDDLKVVTHNDRIVARFSNWNDLKDHLHYGELKSAGNTLAVEKSFITDFLQKRKMCLIIKCHISRKFDDRDRHRSSEENKYIAKLYLIYPHGEVKSLNGRSYKIG